MYIPKDYKKNSYLTSLKLFGYEGHKENDYIKGGYGVWDSPFKKKYNEKYDKYYEYDKYDCDCDDDNPKPTLQLGPMQQELDFLRRRLAEKEAELLKKTKTQQELEVMQKKLDEERARLETERLALEKEKEELEIQKKLVRQALIDSAEIQLT